MRGTISIGRRLQDPLSELVKIEPQNIGVGLYQQDIEPKRLKESLDAVVESCVNQVGVDLNTASVSLLRHVSGLNQLAARELVDYRGKNGPFKSREQLLQVPGIGPARFTQAAGFLKIVGGENPLDETWVHPESYSGVSTLLGEMGIEPVALRSKEKLADLSERLKGVAREEICNRLSMGMPTFQDICQALIRPGRDPREDLPPPIFKKGILKLDDLQPGHGAQRHRPECCRFRRLRRCGPEGQRAGAHQSDVEPVHSQPVRNRRRRRYRHGLGAFSRSGAAAGVVDHDQAGHRTEAA